MSIQRFTLLPQHDDAADGEQAEPVQPVEPAVEVASISRLAKGGRWQTEAMRSYTRPVLLWITRGQGKITVSGRSSGYGTHNAIFLPAGTMHGYSVMGQVMGSLVFLPRGNALDWPTRPVHLRLRDGRLQREMTGLIDTMEREATNQDAQTARALHHHAGLLSVWLDRVIARGDEQAVAHRETTAHRLVEAYTALIERDFRRPVGVAHFAEALGVTPTHLARVCAQVSGQGALDLLKDRRHYEARRLLRNTDRKIADIARDVGFSSAAYFTRAFAAETGKSPSAFRRDG